MTADRTNYAVKAEEDAMECAEHFEDTLCQMWRDDRKLSTDLNNDYRNGDAYHHENHTDKAYSLADAAKLLDDLADSLETDNGLWDGQDPREAISTQAAYTYGNAVSYYWSAIIDAINEDYVGGILADMLGQDDPASEDEVRGRIKAIAEETV